MLSCVDIYKPNYVVSADLVILNYTETPKPTGTTFTVMPKQMTQCKLPMKWLCKMANSVMGVSGELLEYHHLIANQTTRATWQHSYGNEIGCLTQGMPGGITGTNTIVFIKKNRVPHNRAKDLTYRLITCLIRPEEIEEPNKTRLVAGGNRVYYPGDAGTPTTNLLTVKLLINSTISTPNAKYMTIDIKDFYLNTPMAQCKYMRGMPNDVIKHYNLTDLVTPDGYIYCKIKKGMYSLPQARIIAQQLIEKQLQQHRYRQCKTTPGLWKHNTRPISFILVIDNFGVKYVGEENTQHLLETVRQFYKCLCDCDSERYCGLTIKWEYNGQKVHQLMPNHLN